MKSLPVILLSTVLSSCFSTTPNKGEIKQISNNVYKTTYEHYWRAPWSNEDITLTATTISIKNCENKGKEFVMKSHYFEVPNINIIYSCVNYNDKSLATEQLRAESKVAISNLEVDVTDKERKRAEKKARRKAERKDSPSFLGAINAGLQGMNKAMADERERQKEARERQRDRQRTINCTTIGIHTNCNSY